MRALIILSACFLSLSLSLFCNAEPHNSRTFVNASQLTQHQTMCWYDDKRYSEGALISVDTFNLLCGAKNPNQTNSALIWFKLNEQGKVIYPNRPKKITVK